MANPGERSIHIVTANKPKVRRGLSQQGTVAGTRSPPFLVMGITRSRWTERASPTRMFLGRNMATPYVSHKGKRAVRRAHRRAGMRGGKKPRPSCSGGERGGASGNRTPRASELTSLWSFVTRECGSPPEERRQRTAGPPTGALSPPPVAWHTIDWYAVHRTVRRLQARLVKAVQAGRWGQVRALQQLLTHSCSGKALAGKRVTSNEGHQTPGVDGISWNTPEKNADATQALRQRSDRPRPLRRLDIRKNAGTARQRPLSIPPRHDRAMQALSLRALDPIAETLGEPHSSGFRTERSTADALEQCCNALARQHSPQGILEGDIRACFDGSSQAWFVAHMPMDHPRLWQWLKAGFVDKQVLSPTAAGVPQGGMASPVIANLALDGLARLVRAHSPPNTRRAQQAKGNLVRSADDFSIPGSSSALLEQEVQPLVEQLLRQRGWELSPEKPRRTPSEDGCDFLGHQVRKYAGKLLSTPARKTVKACLGKVRHIVQANKQATTGKLIAQLHPVIRGWAHSHRQVVSKTTVFHVDTALFKGLWSWATRRHPKQPGRWMATKYFRTRNGRKWTCVGTRVGTGGHPHERTRCRAGDVPIQRPVKSKGTANPYDPQWEGDFAERLRVKMTHDLKGRRQLLYLWKQQDGLCPVCHQKSTRLTGWHTHHLVWRTHGGSDTADNRMRLHPNCHRQVHSHTLDVARPRSLSSV
jgi:RNA-directed DNA polymerase